MRGNRSNSSARSRYSPMRLARIRAGFDQGDIVSGRLGIHRNTLYRYERGDTYPTVEILLMLADLYDCTLDSLVGRRARSSNGNQIAQPQAAAR